MEPAEHAIPAEELTEVDRRALGLAVELAVANVGEGGGPFGAVLLRDGEVLATGQNRVTRDNDPTAHAEVVAIRAACAALETFSLPGCTLYASCEPCPLCLSASLWARLDRVLFAADRHDAARGGFDDSAFYAMWTDASHTWTFPLVHRADLPGATAPFEAWQQHEARTHY